MSIANNYSLTSNDRCHNCGTINVNGTVCSQCQSESFEDVPIQTQNDGISTEDIPQQLSSGNGNEQTSLLREFQNLLNNGYDRQLFTIMLLSMLMSNAQSRLAQHRHRRNRPQRRIKRVTHSLSRYRHLPFLDLSSFHAINTSVSETLTLNIIPEELLNIQFQPNMTLVPVSVPFVIFDQNEDNVDPELLLQLLNEDIGSLSVTRNDVNQLPTLAMTQSNLSVNPSCTICLENFDSLSQVKQLPACHHVFHTNCLAEWLLNHGNCPMCRTIIIPSI